VKHTQIQKWRISTSALRLLGVIAVFAVFVGFPPPLEAAKDCAVFTATLIPPSGASTIFSTPIRTVVSASQIPGGSVLNISGTFTTFQVDLDTFIVFDHTLTGADAPNQITDTVTRIFESKVPDQGLLTGDLVLELKASGQNLTIERAGASGDMKIQAKDCDQGGLFQMEPEPATTETNTLDAAFRYCFQADASARRFFTNNVVLGYDSPQDATLLSGDAQTAQWLVQDGGRIGMVVGEDAVEALALEDAAAIAACPHQTP
jgi:hypothetical protein